MKLKINKKPLTMNMPSGSVIEAETINTNTYINGSELTELVSDIVNEYLDEHSELLVPFATVEGTTLVIK